MDRTCHSEYLKHSITKNKLDAVGCIVEASNGKNISVKRGESKFFDTTFFAIQLTTSLNKNLW